MAPKHRPIERTAVTKESAHRAGKMYDVADTLRRDQLVLVINTLEIVTAFMEGADIQKVNQKHDTLTEFMGDIKQLKELLATLP